MSRRYDRRLDKEWLTRGRVFIALGDSHRQRILLMFQKGEKLTIKDIADASPLSRTAVAHLRPRDSVGAAVVAGAPGLSAAGLALRRLLVERLALYTVIHRFKPQPLLPRVLRNWARLNELAESLEGVPQAA